MNHERKSRSRASRENEPENKLGQRVGALSSCLRAVCLAAVAASFCAIPISHAEQSVDTLQWNGDVPESLVAKLRRVLSSSPQFSPALKSWEGSSLAGLEYIEPVQKTDTESKILELENAYVGEAGVSGVGSDYKPANALNLFDPLTRPSNYAQQIVNLEDLVSRSVAIIARATQLIVADLIYYLDLGYVSEYTQAIGTTVQSSIACTVSGGYNVSVTRTDFRALEGTISAQQCNNGSFIANGTASFTYDEDLWNWYSDSLPPARALIFTVNNLQLQDNLGRSYQVTGETGCAPHNHGAISRSTWIYVVDVFEGGPWVRLYEESFMFRNTYQEESGWTLSEDGFRVQNGQQTTQIFGDYDTSFCDLNNITVGHQGESISIPELNLGLYYDGYTANNGGTLTNLNSYAGTNTNLYELYGSLPPLNSSRGNFFFSAGLSEPTFHASSVIGELVSLDAFWERIGLPELVGVPGFRVAHLQSYRDAVLRNQYNPDTGRADYGSDFNRSYSADTDDNGVQETITGYARTTLKVSVCEGYKSLRTPSETWHVGYEEFDGSESMCFRRDIFTQSGGLIEKDPDTDGDGRSNAYDPDDDGDGAPDTVDAFRLDPSETTDTDADGVGNNADIDDDNDGTPDNLDAFPLDSSETLDTDGDGIGNNADLDDDGDGVSDVQDAFPLDAAESKDTDADGIGNNADPDDDNDGASDEEEIDLGSNPLDPDSDDDGLFDGLEVSFGTDPLDADTDGDSLGDGQEIELGLNPLDPNDCPEDYCPSTNPLLKLIPILLYKQDNTEAN